MLDSEPSHGGAGGLDVRRRVARFLIWLRDFIMIFLSRSRLLLRAVRTQEFEAHSNIAYS